MEPRTVIDIQSLLDMIELESKTPGPKITIYLSVPRSSAFAMTVHAALKAHIHVVADRLKRLGTTEEQSKVLLDRIRLLLEEGALGTRRSEGFAIFASSAMLRFYGLPLPIRDEIWVSDEFLITPLIHLLSLPEHFYLLEASLGKPRMARVHPQFASPVSLEKVWALEASWSKEVPIPDRAFHSAGSSASGHHGTIPNGGSDDSAFRKRQQMFSLLAKTVDEALEHEHVPLVITGVSEVVAQFRKHLRYKNVLLSPETILIPQNGPIALDTSIWRACVQIYSMQSLKEPPEEALIEPLRAQGRVVEDLDEILSLSEAGGVMTIIVNESARAPGGSESSEAELNAAVITTLQHHGKAVESDTLQSSTGVAAILRPGTHA